MTTEVLAQTVGPGVIATFGAGSMWYLKTAQAPVTIIAESQGSGSDVNRFINVSAGFRFIGKLGQRWKYLRVTSATVQNIELVVGDDDVSVAGAVSVVGTVATTVNQAGTIPDTPNVALPNAAQTPLFAANAARYMITVSNPSTAAGSFFIRTHGGANNLFELQPGTYAQFNTTAALDARNDSGGALVAMILEALP